MHQLHRLSSLSLAACATLFLACAAEPEPATGSVGMALTTTDAEGTTYRLTPGARLALYSDTFYDEFTLDGDAPTTRIDVPPGGYTAELIHPSGEPLWPLERTAITGETDTVSASLVTPMPVELAIASDIVTPLVLRFEIPELGEIVFESGSVDVSIEVAGSTPPNLDVLVDGALDVTTVTNGPVAPAALAPRLPALGDTGIGFDVDLRVVGPWVKASSTSACAPVNVTSIGSPHGGVSDLLADAASPGQNLCIDSGAGVGGPAIASLVQLRSGTPTTTTFSDLGDGNYLFVAFWQFEIPDGVFDGETLDLNPLVGAHSYPAFALLRVSVRPPAGGVRDIWYRANLAGNLTLSLVPQP